jgi:hypothetical protein
MEHIFVRNLTKYNSHILGAKRQWKKWKHSPLCVIQIFDFQIGTAHHIKYRSVVILFIFDNMGVKSEKEFL